MPTLPHSATKAPTYAPTHATKAPTYAPTHAPKAPTYSPYTTRYPAYTTRPPPPPYCPPGTWLNKVTGECDCEYGYVLDQYTYQCDCPKGLVVSYNYYRGHLECGCPYGQYRRYGSHVYECSYKAPAYSTEAPYHATKAPAYPPHTTKYTTRPPPPPYCPPGTWLNKVTGECDCEYGYVLNQKTYQCDCPEGLFISLDKKLGHLVCGCPDGRVKYGPHLYQCTYGPAHSQCPKGLVYNEEYYNCTCPHGRVYNAETYECECPYNHCPEGYESVAVGYQCVCRCARTCEYGYTLNEKTCTCERDQPNCSCVPRSRGSAGHCEKNDEHSCNRLSGYCDWRCDYY